MHRSTINIASVGALALAAGMRGAAMALPTNEPKLSPPPYVRDMTRRQRKKHFKRMERRAEHNRRRKLNLEAPRKKSREEIEHQRIVNGMSNWQAAQYSKAVGAARRANEPKPDPKPFAVLVHWKTRGVV